MRTQDRQISQKTIEKLQAPATGNLIRYDGEIPGFGVRITAAGVISFILNYRINGRERRYTIGRYPELSAMAAREEAIKLRGGIQKGNDPLDEKQARREAPTVNDLSTEYLERHAKVAKRESSQRDDKNMLKSIIKPRLGALKVASVGQRDIENIHIF